ncbi:MAG: leucine-rich repeat domain-containing protein [Holosporales bacterium]|nr:leucine-rich repeat domain-containing protein [Holosporales bacterium]
MQSITIPKSVVFCEGSFCGCRVLTSVVFEEGSRLTEIGFGTFFACSSLRSITIPKSVRVICCNSFASCSSLLSVTFMPDFQLQEIEEGAFSRCLQAQVIFPNEGRIPAVLFNQGWRRPTG